MPNWSAVTCPAPAPSAEKQKNERERKKINTTRIQKVRGGSARVVIGKLGTGFQKTREMAYRA